VDDPQRLASAWDEALGAGRPVVLEVKTDPEVPLLPPHITFDQARKFSHMLLAGDPRESSVLKGAVKQLAATLVPHSD
jgi:pyruvate dehydrogenase (quinone)